MIAYSAPKTLEFSATEPRAASLLGPQLLTYSILFLSSNPSGARSKGAGTRKHYTRVYMWSWATRSDKSDPIYQEKIRSDPPRLCNGSDAGRSIWQLKKSNPIRKLHTKIWTNANPTWTTDLTISWVGRGPLFFYPKSNVTRSNLKDNLRIKR